MPDDLARAYAPFTPDQVESLNGYQQSGLMHPFTCADVVHDDTDDEVFADPVLLVATEAGWVCPREDCDYTQGWAHDWMANGLWRSMAAYR